MKIKKINKTVLFYAFICSIFFIPAEYAVPSFIYSIWQMLIVGASILVITMYLNKRKYSNAWIIAIVFALHYCIISTAINGKMILLSGVFVFIRFLGFFTLAEYGTKYHFSKFIKGLLYAGIVMCGIHFVTFLMFTNTRGGMNAGEISEGVLTSQHWYFFSHANGSVFYFIPILGIAWFYTFEFNPDFKLKAVLINAITIAMYIKDKSVTAAISSIALLLVACLWSNKYVSKVIDFFSGYFIVHIYGMITCIVIIYLNISGTFLKVFYFFGKIKYASSRAMFWSASMRIFLNHPISGIGFESTATTIMNIGKNHCHNIIIQIIYTSGLVGLVLYVLLIYHCKPQKQTMNNYGIVILYMVQFILWIAGTFDWYLFMTIPFSLFVIIKNYIPQRLKGKTL